MRERRERASERSRRSRITVHVVAHCGTRTCVHSNAVLVHRRVMRPSTLQSYSSGPSSTPGGQTIGPSCCDSYPLLPPPSQTRYTTSCAQYMEAELMGLGGSYGDWTAAGATVAAVPCVCRTAVPCVRVPHRCKIAVAPVRHKPLSAGALRFYCPTCFCIFHFISFEAIVIFLF